MSASSYLLTAIEVTGPLLLILLAGFGLRRFELIDAAFVATGNRLVFNIALPSLLFLGTARQPLEQSLNPPLVASPSAAASYVMARQYTEYAALAAESIALSTVLCPFSLSAGFVLLSIGGWV